MKESTNPTLARLVSAKQQQDEEQRQKDKMQRARDYRVRVAFGPVYKLYLDTRHLRLKPDVAEKVYHALHIKDPHFRRPAWMTLETWLTESRKHLSVSNEWRKDHSFDFLLSTSQTLVIYTEHAKGDYASTVYLRSNMVDRYEGTWLERPIHGIDVTFHNEEPLEQDQTLQAFRELERVAEEWFFPFLLKYCEVPSA